VSVAEHDANDGPQATVLHLASLQCGTGLILLAHGSGGDPWNHVEAAIGLDIAGQHDLALRAYHWLVAAQLEDGSFFATYDADGRPTASHVDTNAVGYVASGVLARLLATRDEAGCDELFPTVEAALDYVADLERGTGVVPWSVDGRDGESPLRLLAGSSSLVSSFRHGAELASRLGHDGIRWRAASDRMAGEIAAREQRFADKSEFAMDWYYPVLAGVIHGGAARKRLSDGESSFVTSDGVLCRSDRRWVTSAETAESAMAYVRAGDAERGKNLFATLADKRLPNGGYLTGLVYPERSEFPQGESTSYSDAAVLIAADVLAGGVANELFGDAAPAFEAPAPVARSTRKLSAA
jgi:hypothetical protein